jgi:topoisomerase IV subunit A
MVGLTVLKGKKEEEAYEELDLAEFIDIKGWKSQGNRISPHNIKEIAPLQVEETAPPADLKVGGTVEWDIEQDSKKGNQGELF